MAPRRKDPDGGHTQEHRQAPRGTPAPRGRGRRGEDGLPPSDAHACLSMLLDATRDIFLVVDAEGRYEFGNEAFLRLCGRTRDELAGRRVLPLLPPELRGIVLERWAESRRGKEGPYELDVRLPNGERRSLFVRHRHAAVGGRSRYCVVGKDVTAHKAAQHELTDHRDRLETLVASRTASLAELGDRLQHRLRLERLAARVSSRLLNVTPEETDREQDEVLAETGRVLQADAAALVEYGGSARLTRLWRRDGGASSLRLPRSLERSVYAWAASRAERGEIVRLSGAGDVPAEALPVTRALRRVGIGSLTLAPVLYQQRIWGAIGLATPRSGRDWDEDELRVLRMVGEALAGARVRADAEHRVRVRLRHETFLASSARMLGTRAVSSLRRGTQAVLREALTVLHADAVLLTEIGPAAGRARLLHCVPAGIARARLGKSGVFDLADFPRLGPLLCGKRPHYQGDASTLPPGTPERAFAERLGMRSRLLVPLSTDGKATGAISLMSREPYRAWSSVQQHTAELLGALILNAVLRHEAVARLKKSETRFRRVYQAMPDVVLTLRHAGEDYVLEHVNDGAVRASNGKILRAVGRPIGSLAHSLSRFQRLLDECRTTGKAVHDSFWFPSPWTGRRHFHSVVAFGIERDVIICVARDETKERMLERELVGILDAERARISRDLHDALGQQLAGTALMSDAARRKLEAEEHPEAASVKRIADHLREALAQARAMARGLAPLRLETDGLASCLRHLADQVGEAPGRTCLFEDDGGVRMRDTSMASHVYYIAQEALANALRHTKASSSSSASSAATAKAASK